MPTRKTLLPQLLLCFLLILAINSVGCRAGQTGRPGLFQQPGPIVNGPSAGQLGQRVGNIAINRLINAGITRVISGF